MKRLIRSLLNKMLYCGIASRNDVEFVVCEHIGAWRLVTPQVNMIGALGDNLAPQGLHEGFQEAIRQAASVEDTVTLEDVRNLLGIVEGEFKEEGEGVGIPLIMNGKG